MNEQEIREKFEQDMETLDEFTDALERAQDVLSRGLSLLEEAVEIFENGWIECGNISANSLRAYMIGHLENWIHGGNPYDQSIDTLLSRDIEDARTELKEMLQWALEDEVEEE